MSKCPCCGTDFSEADRPLVSLDTNRIMAGGEIVQLSPTEAEFASILLKAMPLGVERERIIARLWGAAPINDPEKALHVYATKLRKRLKPIGVGIRSIWGIGYAMEYLKTEERVAA